MKNRNVSSELIVRAEALPALDMVYHEWAFYTVYTLFDNFLFSIQQPHLPSFWERGPPNDEWDQLPCEPDQDLVAVNR